jgi:membrane protein
MIKPRNWSGRGAPTVWRWSGALRHGCGQTVGMSLTAGLDALQRRHPAAGFPIAVAYKFFDDQGSYLAALITYYGFLSLFPLLLLLSTILGLVLRGNPQLQREVLDSALGQFPVIGSDLGRPKHLGGGTTGLVIGILGSLYGGLGVGQALQNAMDTAWAVPKNRRPNPLKARGRSLLLLVTAGLAILGTTAVTALGSGGGSWAAGLGGGWKAVLLIVSVTINFGVFVLAFRIATARRLSVREIAPGAAAAALVWQVLQSFGAVYVGHVIKGASATNGTFALVLGLIAFIYLAAVALVLCVEINVVRVEALHPRALLTPFTDDVELTEGDRSAYTGLAQAQRNKGFQEIDVRFDEERRNRREKR